MISKSVTEKLVYWSCEYYYLFPSFFFLFLSLSISPISVFCHFSPDWAICLLLHRYCVCWWCDLCKHFIDKSSHPPYTLETSENNRKTIEKWSSISLWCFFSEKKFLLIIHAVFWFPSDAIICIALFTF